MRRFLPSLSALHAFESTARHMSFTRAADDLGITQSGVSRQIKSLEDYLGVTLFERRGSRLVLTDNGRVYATEVNRLLDMLEQASIDVVRGGKAHSDLLVGSLPTLASRWLSSRLDRFTSANPECRIEITPAVNNTDFNNTPMDVAILRGAGSWTDASSYELFPEEIVVVASPSLIPAGATLDPITFAKFPLLQNAARPSLWLQWIRASKVDYRGTIQGPRFAQTAMLLNAAVSGMGLAVAPTVLVERELTNGALHTPFGPPVETGDSYYVVFPDRKAHFPAVKAFRDWIMRETRPQRL
jgi:LysR family glycine cleavage system transcriptional activator